MDAVTTPRNADTIIDAHSGELVEPARLVLPGGRRMSIEVVEGCSIAELVEQVPVELRCSLQVYNRGTLVVDWDNFHTRAGDRLLMAVIPQGGGGSGKSILGAVLMIAVAVVAPYAGAAIAAGVGASAAVGTMIGVGLTMVAGMVINALIAPPAVSTKNISPGTGGSYTLTGQSNQPRPFQTVFVVYGRYKMMPTLATNANVDNFANQSQISALYDFGLGYRNFYELKIGDVDIAQYSPSLVSHWNSYCDDLRLNPAKIGYDQYAFNLARYDPVTVRTKPNAYCANLDIQFPKGIFQAAPAYGQIPWWADFVAYWRTADTGTWQEVPIDWYYGAMGRQYTTPQAGITYELPGYYGPTVYDPATSPADLRAKAAAWKAAQAQATTAYRDSSPNGYLTFTYPYGDINEQDYFNRYPEVRAGGWVGTARANFESVGSREGRNPGVPVIIWGLAGPVTYNTDMGLFGIPLALHNFDGQNAALADPRVGGYAWINSGLGLTPQPQAAPWAWNITDPGNWNPAAYLARYPDVAAAGADPWTHFTTAGAFEGRDPYVAWIARSVRLTACWVGTYWMRIFLVFPVAGTYEIQIMRTDKIEDGTDTSIQQSSGGAVTARFSESVVALLRSYIAGLPVQPRLRHTMLEMMVTATDQLQGVVQNLSAIVVSVLPVTNDGVNFWWAETRNPAWICIDILMSERNSKPLSAAQIDWPSWLHLAAVCDSLRSWVVNGLPFTAPRYTCDIIVDGLTTVKTLIESILSACRASLVLTNAGTWGVLSDEEKTVPRQLLTPANSWGFSGNRTFTVYPHALRVNFIDSANEAYTQNEVTCYADGYDASNATIFETLDTFGVTDFPHAWAYGRYMLAQGIQRSETFTLTMDVENLLVQRGDMVYVAHDVPRVGGVPARIVDVGGPSNHFVRIDQPLSFFPSGYALRRSDGTTRTGVVMTDITPPGPDWVEIDDTANVLPDDLIVVGDFDRVTQPYLVQRITPGADLTAELTLCKYAPGVYTADIGVLPVWDPGFGHDYLNGTDLRCQFLTATQTLYYVARMPFVDVQLNWQTTGWNLNHHELTVILPSGKRVTLSEALPQSYLWTVDALSQREMFNVPLQFEVYAVNALGFQGIPSYATIVLLRDTSPPQPVQTFGVNVQKETVEITWQPPTDPDIAYYAIRYTPQVEIPNWDSAQDLATFAWPATQESAGARTGSYGIRVVDTSGNIGPVTWRRTTVAFLPDINVITVLNDALLDPNWPGVRSHVDKVGSEIENSGEWGAIYPNGIYYCRYFVDLGDVYEARVSSKIEAYGMTSADLMVNWSLLSEVLTMSNSLSALWDAWLEVRTADAMMFIDQWELLSDVDTMADADDGSWTAWRPCTVGDFTGRLFAFRICLQSRNTGVRAVVRSGRIEVDMPDRIDSYGDVQVPANGIDFEFPVAFRSLEALAITIDGNADPVVAVVSNKQPTGFHLTLNNTQTGALTAGQVDIMAQGYGRTGLTSI